MALVVVHSQAVATRRIPASGSLEQEPHPCLASDIADFSSRRSTIADCILQPVPCSDSDTLDPPSLASLVFADSSVPSSVVHPASRPYKAPSDVAGRSEMAPLVKLLSYY